MVLIDAINGLCRRFHIITPYSFSYRQPAHHSPVPKAKIKEHKKSTSVSNSKK
jgi:hypothetical protein